MTWRIFIGCASEALDIAQAIQRNLEKKKDLQIQIWDQGASTPGSNIIDELIAFTREYDFGIFIFSADQMARRGEKSFKATAGNTIFEAGLFASVLGKERTFIVSEEEVKLRLPSDLDGILRPTFKRSVDEDELPARLATTCTDITRAIRKQLDRDKKRLNEARNAKTPEVERALQLLCNAIAAPGLPENFGIRAFVFGLRDASLVNMYQWSRHDDLEHRGTLCFDIDDDRYQHLVVVRSVNSPKPVSELIDNASQVKLSKEIQVAPQIRFVVASAIRDSEGRVRGVVDLDCIKEEGVELLKSEGVGGILRTFAEILCRIDAL